MSIEWGHHRNSVLSEIVEACLREKSRGEGFTAVYWAVALQQQDTVVIWKRVVLDIG